MSIITETAYAKINLGLDVIGRRDNGYHEVDMIMQTVGISDTVEISRASDISMEIRQSSSGEELSAGEDNLCIKAARAILPEGEGVHIVLHKNIPIAAGMAGGSTDAAAVLRGVNALFDLGLSTDRLREAGVRLGADIPFCVIGGCHRSRGIGEILTPISPATDWSLLIAKPAIAVSTAEVYKGYDSAIDVRHPDIDALEQALFEGDERKACMNMGNVLAPVTIGMHPVIGDVIATMTATGALHAMMTGSGPTVFGIYESDEACETAKRALAKKDLCPEIFVTHTVMPSYGR